MRFGGSTRRAGAVDALSCVITVDRATQLTLTLRIGAAW